MNYIYKDNKIIGYEVNGKEYFYMQPLKLFS